MIANKTNLFFRCVRKSFDIKRSLGVRQLTLFLLENPLTKQPVTYCFPDKFMLLEDLKQ